MNLYYNNTNYLSAGTVEVKGDFADTANSNSYYHYWETGTHKTIFSGNSVQNVSFVDPEDNRFETLILRNNSEDGVVFNSHITVGTLFDHNRCAFTLYDNGSDSSFVDYDQDGLLDHQDEYPTIPFAVVRGDANLDGIVSIGDVTAVQRWLVELQTFSDEQIALADANGDGEINISDATYLQMVLAQ